MRAEPSADSKRFARAQRWDFVFWCLACALACGDDKKDTEAKGEPCQMVGQAQTGCACSSTQPPGVRSCTMELIWGPCSCPPPNVADQCKPGDTVLCSVCPGESVGRPTKCLQGNTYDCTCDGPPPNGGGAAGSGRN